MHSHSLKKYECIAPEAILANHPRHIDTHSIINVAFFVGSLESKFTLQIP